MDAYAPAKGHDFVDDEEYCRNGCMTKNPDYHPPVEYIVGDTDNDGKVTILDATCIQRWLAGLPNQIFVEEAADTDDDGKTTILDATAI